MEMFSQANLLA